ncbi:MAG TPA: chromosome partitioning protein [Gammaproteobacteria bacterium]|nr:chromosome partitioning protein [Gammaproteobacteria bacterium]|tara:strand:+ start:648 stop:1307 length:660 start_codon:yes stop_codon:yes gene_type:complete
MRTILVLNAKGGSGKTTVATNLAGYFANEGAKVALVDLDPQGSSLDWLRARAADRPKISAVEGFTKGIRVPRNTEVVIMDAPSRTHDKHLSALVRRAQTIVLPIVPSPIDIRAAQRFLGELRGLRNVIKTDVKMATVANRVREGTLIANELEDYLYELKLPSGRKFPFMTVLRSSANYLRAAERGLSIFEFAPVATAADREYWNPLTRWLKSARSLPGN